ncbi:MAG: metallophosphoesterase [Balneolales bacterium]
MIKKTALNHTTYPVNRAEKDNWVITRRVFLKSSALALGGFCLHPFLANAGKGAMIRFGVVTDSHYAEIEPSNTRYYRESLSKMTECVDLMNDKKVDLLIHLGDLINGAPSNNREHLQKVESILSRYQGPRYHVLGNHDMDKISKSQFLEEITNTGVDKNANYYSFDHKEVHFINLDSNYIKDGTHYDSGNHHWTDANIPDDQLRWLENDLNSTSKNVIVCNHQLLDLEGDYSVNNAAEVRSILEQNSKVLAVFQGHKHTGQYNIVNGIHYYTLKGMVEGSGEENNSYAIVEVFDDASMVITGYRKSVSKKFGKVPENEK